MLRNLVNFIWYRKMSLIGVKSGKSQEPKPIPTYVRFVIGGLAGMGATCVSHPLDVLKTRMQLSGEGTVTKQYKTSIHALVHIVRNEGVLSIYSGITAGLLRQAVYTSTRMGVYSWILDVFATSVGTPPGFIIRSLSGMFAGVMGAFVGNPADVALIRMAGDGRLPPEERRNYKNVFHAIKRIVQEEGILTLFRGVTANMGRAMVVSVSQVVTYSQTKEYLIRTGICQDDVQCHFACSMVSGIVTVLASMPVDIAKTRLQNMKVVDNRPEYRGMFDVWIKVVKKEGVFSLWKGITPSYYRIGPHTLIFFLLLEELTKFYKVNVLKDNSPGGF